MREAPLKKHTDWSGYKQIKGPIVVSLAQSGHRLCGTRRCRQTADITGGHSMQQRSVWVLCVTPR